MKSKWFDIKPKAIELRQEGTSLREVERILNIPRSTLSGWFKDIKLTEVHKNKLRSNWLNALNKARQEAVKWHNNQKASRLKEAKNQATAALAEINNKNKVIQELALAMLYLGEGFKAKSGTGMGNSDPLILKFFMNMLINNYGININKIRCELHLRADQNPSQVKSYWSKELGIPLTSFTSVSIDQRTVGSQTYPKYNGVCVLRCGNIAVQRKLIFLARKFCEIIIDNRAVSSVGRALS